MEGEETNGEAARIEGLRRYRILDTPPEQEYAAVSREQFEERWMDFGLLSDDG